MRYPVTLTLIPVILAYYTCATITTQYDVMKQQDNSSYFLKKYCRQWTVSILILVTSYSYVVDIFLRQVQFTRLICFEKAGNVSTSRVVDILYDRTI